MIDATEDKELAAFERAAARREAKAAYAERKARKEQARLEEIQKSVPTQNRGELQVEAPVATVVVPAAKERHGEEVAYSYLRTARISTACALVLFVFLIWLWSQRRNS
jgi:hypothetical protein